MTSDSFVRALLSLGVVLGVLLGGPSCATHTDGVEVMVGLRSPVTPTSFQTDLGYSVEIDTAYLNFASAELLPCAGAGLVLPRWVAVARAHTTGSPTELGNPRVVDLVGTLGQVEPMGTLLPPPGDYCGIAMTLGPADADAAGLPTEVDMVGQSLLLAGTLTPDGGVPRTFEVTSAAETRVELDFGGPVTLDLDAPLLALVVDADHLGALDGIDFDALGSDELAAAVFQSLAATLQAEASFP